MALSVADSVLLSKPEALLGSDHSSVVSINLFVALICACIVIGHLLEETKWMNESITALAIGLCTGVIILLTTGGKSSRLLVFSEDLFFIYLLPPIIFNAGFQVKKKQFFRNFMTIILFGAIGTLISTGVISVVVSQLGEQVGLLVKKILLDQDMSTTEASQYHLIGCALSAVVSTLHGEHHAFSVMNQELKMRHQRI